MALKMKVTVSLDEALVRELGGVGRERHKSRSQLVEEALRFWQRCQLEQALKEGYMAMAKEDRAVAERHMTAGWEAVR